MNTQKNIFEILYIKMASKDYSQILVGLLVFLVLYMMCKHSCSGVGTSQTPDCYDIEYTKCQAKNRMSEQGISKCRQNAKIACDK
tara:strand:+ start:804 stop:1058 length:255 start_codon:yes stop_codon:yes gene_type:complete